MMLQHDEEVSQPQITELAIDATLADSFPASDPPSWTLGVDRQSERCVAYSVEKKGER